MYFASTYVILFHMQSAPVCDVQLTIEDLTTRHITTLESADITVTGKNITLSTEGLAPYRCYNVTVVAQNSAGPAESFFPISKW